MDTFLKNSSATSPQLVQVCQLLDLEDIFALSCLNRDARAAFRNFHIKLYDPYRDDPQGTGDPSLENGSSVVRSARNSREVQDKRSLSLQPRPPSIWLPVGAFQPLDDKILRMQEIVADSKKYGEREEVLELQIRKLNSLLDQKTASLESKSSIEGKEVEKSPTGHWVLAGANLIVDKDAQSLDVFHSYDPSGIPSTIKHLRLRNCDKLLTLNGLEVFQQLEDIAISSASKVRTLEAMAHCPRLNSINIKCFERLTSLSGLSNTTSLVNVRLVDCPKLASIEGLIQCGNLRTFSVIKCPVTSLAGLQQCGSLKHVHVELCNKLKDIEALSQVFRLEHLTLKECPLVHELPDFSACKNIFDVDLSACRHITDLSGLKNCGESLRHLVLDDCAHLQHLDVLTNLENLETFRASRCRRLIKSVQAVGGIPNIRKFKLTVCSSIKDASPLGVCHFLTHLNLSWNSQLREISGLETCVNLRSANFTHCQSLEDLTGIGGCVNLKYLNLRYCDNLPDLLDLETCTSLQTLDCSCCHRLTDVSYLETCLSLQTIDFSVCKFLSDISALEKLTALQTLYVYKSKRLSTEAIEKVNTNLTVFADRQFRERNVHRNREMLADLEESSDEEDDDDDFGDNI